MLAGKVAIVTGSSRGLGRATVENLAKQGASVVVNYNSNSKEAEEVVSGITSAGGKAIAVQGNVSQKEDIKRLFDEAEKQLGKVDILVCNAGINMRKGFLEHTEDDFDSIIGINLKGTWLCMREAAQRLNDGGRIVTLSTSLNYFFVPHFSIYQASKAGVEQLTRSLSKELGARGISVCGVAPGPCETEMTAHDPPQVLEYLKRMTAFNRIGKAEDIASIVTHLCKPEAIWLSGQIIRCNGAAV